SVPDGIGFPLPHEALPVQDPSQGQDLDGDAVPEAEDNCPGLANPDQANLDGDSFGDACDPDIDGDLLVNSIPNPIRTGPVAGGEVDAFPYDTDNDGIDNVADDDDDGDGVADAVDNCALVPNADQLDVD